MDIDIDIDIDMTTCDGIDIARRTVNIGLDSLMQRSTPEQQLGCCAYDAVACSQLACTRHNAYTAQRVHGTPIMCAIKVS